MAAAPERRRHRRFQLRIPVTVLGGSDQPTSRDLSEGGLFLETHVARPVGVCLPIRLVHPSSGEIIPAVCQVARQVTDSDGRVVGLGLRFAHTDTSLGSRLQALIHDLVERSDDMGEETGAETPASGEVTGAGAIGGPWGDQAFDETEEDAGWENDETVAVVEFDEPGVSWELDRVGASGEPVEVLVVGAEVSAGGDHHPATVPIIWPDTRPEKIPGATRHGLSPMQQRLLAFIDGNNTVEEAAQGAGLELEPALGELSDMARRAVIYLPVQATTTDELEAWEDSTEVRAKPLEVRPLFPGRHEHAAEQDRWRRARDQVTQALAAERNDDFREAVRFLEQALELKPPNAANIHARLAILGMEHLVDYDFAERHARACKEAEPHRPHGQRLLRRIKRLRARPPPARSRGKNKRKAKAGRTTGKELRRGPARQRWAEQMRPRRGTLVALMVIAILGLLGFNFYKYLLPLVSAPPRLDIQELAFLIPTAEARLSGRKLVITTTNDWDTLTDMEKSNRLERLAEWADRVHGVREVLVADSLPVLRARVRDREVEIFD